MTPAGRLPAYFVPHGGGPWPFVAWPPELQPGNDALAAFLRGLLADAGATPRAILIVSAHWEAPAPAVLSRPQHDLLYDYTGFPPETYRLQYPAPGDAALAQHVGELLRAAGFAPADERARGLDHGVFIPLMLVAPEATIPVVQLSLVETLDPATHLALGRAIAPLRDGGVLVIGSGMSYHNMRGFFSGGPPPGAAAFDTWLGEAVTGDPGERDARLARWRDADGARLAHPREEHLIPLMVAAGTAPGEPATRVFHAPVLGAPVSGFRFG